ncbi:hypothetical protein HPB47_026724 [Ixodes persulcatus]|uniref:Uncharacterized protein n=1 Tax=Ixodes persulcatus TaxID=34615 RepID=A0AC60PXV8_IXOPE|nr:hypothetical protein HPB47_026724 [Ixodes persulcatus]
MAQQTELMGAIVSALRAPLRPRFELVKPDIFDGFSSSAEAWIDFYEYAAEKNYWVTEEDWIKNMRLYLNGIDKKWYDLHLRDHPAAIWSDWKDSFLTSFQENAVERWDRAIFFKFRSGSPLEYFYEKRRLLQLAEPGLPPPATVALITHGLPRDLQRQVQVRSPKSVEALLQCLQDLPNPLADKNQYQSSRMTQDSTGRKHDRPHDRPQRRNFDWNRSSNLVATQAGPMENCPRTGEEETKNE